MARELPVTGIVIGTNVISATDTGVTYNGTEIGGTIIFTGGVSGSGTTAIELIVNDDGHSHTHTTLPADILVDTDAVTPVTISNKIITQADIIISGTTTLTVTGNILSTNILTKIQASSIDIIATLPSAVGLNGKVFYIKRIDNTTNIVTVNTTAGQTIDGVSTGQLNPKDSLAIISDNANWHII